MDDFIEQRDRVFSLVVADSEEEIQIRDSVIRMIAKPLSDSSGLLQLLRQVVERRGLERIGREQQLSHVEFVSRHWFVIVVVVHFVEKLVDFRRVRPTIVDVLDGSESPRVGVRLTDIVGLAVARVHRPQQLVAVDDEYVSILFPNLTHRDRTQIEPRVAGRDHAIGEDRLDHIDELEFIFRRDRCPVGISDVYDQEFLRMRFDERQDLLQEALDWTAGVNGVSDS